MTVSVIQMNIKDHRNTDKRQEKLLLPLLLLLNGWIKSFSGSKGEQGEREWSGGKKKKAILVSFSYPQIYSSCNLSPRSAS